VQHQPVGRGAWATRAFNRFLADRLRNSSVPASRLCLELTETSAVRDLGRAQRFINDLRALGCRFALDDFGTGFCSFNYLRSLDVEYFKIDGSFVRDLETSPLSMAVIRSITDIAHVLDKQTIAEHTENEAILASLRELGVDYAQGYGIHRPEPLATTSRTLRCRVAPPRPCWRRRAPQGSRCASAGSGAGQARLQVREQVVAILDTHRQAQQAVADARHRARLRAHRGMGHRRRMRDQRFHAAQRLGQGEMLQAVEEGTHCRQAAAQFQRKHGAESALLARRQGVLRMAGQAR
jgi:hypothetical protein